MNFHEMRAERQQSTEQESSYESLIESQSQKILELRSQLSDSNAKIVQIEQEMYELNRENENLLKLAEEPKSVLDELRKKNSDLNEKIEDMTAEKELWKKKAETPQIVYQDREVLHQKCEKCVKENFHKAKEEYKEKLQKLKAKEEGIDWSLECKQRRLDQQYKAYTTSYKPFLACALIYWVIRLLIDLEGNKALTGDISGYIDLVMELFTHQEWGLVLLIVWSMLTLLAIFSLLTAFGDIFSKGYLILIATLLTALGEQIRAFMDINLLALGSIAVIVFWGFRIGFRIWWNN